MSDYRIEIKVKNNNLLKKIEECGYSSVGEFCRLNNKMNWAGTIGEFVNLKKSPLNRRGQFLSIIHQICDLLFCSPEELFSDIQLTTAMESNKHTIQVNEAEMQFMLQNRAEQVLVEHQVHKDRLPDKINELLETITPREAKIISMRFGLGDYSEAMTSRDIASQFNITPARIIQIEQKAMRKMRHSKRADIVKDHINL